MKMVTDLVLTINMIAGGAALSKSAFIYPRAVQLLGESIKSGMLLDRHDV